MNNSKLSNRLKHIILSGIFLTIVSCSAKEEGCKTETVCFGEGNCIEKPIPGTCF